MPLPEKNYGLSTAHRATNRTNRLQSTEVLEHQFPELIYMPSTAKSPQQMFGAITKSYYAQKIGVAPENIGWRFEEFYIVGSFTGDNGWGFEALSKDAVQMNLFHYGAVIPWKADGDFKFTSVTDFGRMLSSIPLKGTLRILPLQLYWEVKTINGK